MLTRLRCLLWLHRWQLQPTDASDQRVSCANHGKRERRSVDYNKVQEQFRNIEYRGGPGGGPTP
jgi:hypothetical protein